MEFPPGVENDEAPRIVDRRDSLLQKYDIPITHLDFAYVEKCSDSKEIERILQILQSGEEGYYPDLLAATEDRLRKIKPTSRYIRKLTPVVDKNSLDQHTRTEVHGEITTFLENAFMQDAELGKYKKTAGCTGSIPQVRKKIVVDVLNQCKSEEKPNRIKATDYTSWDKYDADTEILKMDLETEQLQKDQQKVQVSQKNIEKDLKQVQFYTKTEAMLEANQERLKGNEYYRSRDYNEALECYTNCINIQPTLEGYNNRAQVHIMLKNYQKALDDGKSALKFDANNIKANMRMAQSLNELHMYSDAIYHLEKIIRIDPNNKNAQNLLNTVRSKCDRAQNSETTRNARTRLKITEISSGNAEKRIQTSPNTKYHKQRRSRRRSILKKTQPTRQSSVLVPIPGPSHMKEPYYVVLEDNDPETVKRAQYILYNKPQVTYVGQPYETDDEDLTTHPDTNNGENIPENLNTFSDGDVFSKPDIANNEKNALRQESAEICSISDENCNYTADDEFINLKNDMDQCTISDNCVYYSKSDISIEKDKQNGGGGEPHEGRNPLSVDTENIEVPFSFLKAWLAARRDPTYHKQANLLRKLNGNRLADVIGCKLDGTMLTDIVRTLCSHFTVAHEVERLHTLLVNLATLPRFNICTLFLAAHDRIKIRNMFEFLEQHGISVAEVTRTAYS